MFIDFGFLVLRYCVVLYYFISLNYYSLYVSCFYFNVFIFMKLGRTEECWGVVWCVCGVEAQEGSWENLGRGGEEEGAGSGVGSWGTREEGERTGRRGTGKGRVGDHTTVCGRETGAEEGTTEVRQEERGHGARVGVLGCV